MPRVTISFNLPDEEAEFRCAIDGGDYLTRLCMIDQWCRDRLKHGEPGDQERLALTHIRTMIGEVHE
jgi:hypothetical protein